MALGALESSVMDLLWEVPGGLTGKEVQARLDEAGDGPAVTTVLTVLSRLERKGLVARAEGVRPHRYRAVRSREEHTAELLHDILGTAPDRQAVLARFVGGIGPEETAALRRLLG